MTKTKIIDVNFPKTLNVSPDSLNSSAVQNNPTGFDKQKYNLSISPNNTWYRNNTFLNVLPAVPDTIQPNQCVSVRNNQQNITGVVCNYSENLNKVRGNQFGIKYQNNLRRNKFLYNNVRLNSGDTTVVTESPFYPEPNYNYIKDSRYKTYPHSEIYKNGMPLYKYPYSNTLNSTEFFTNNNIEHFGNEKMSCNISIIICAILVLITIALYSVS